MEYQDFKPVTIGKPVSLNSLPKKILPKNTTDMHKIKIENETENFNVVKIPSGLSREITNARTAKKMTQKEVSNHLNIQNSVYVELENGKAIYDGKTKQLIQKVAKLFGTKFSKY